MDSTNQSPVGNAADSAHGPEVEFLPDADELERQPLPRIARLTLHLMVLVLVSFVIWASLSEVEQVVVAKGKLVNSAPNIVVQPLQTSIIQSVDVSIGQVISKGEQLATLDTTFSQADEAQLENRLRSLDIQQQSLQAELAGTAGLEQNSTDADTLLQSTLASERKANYTAQILRLDESIARIAAMQQSNRSDQHVLDERLKSLREMEAMHEKLVAESVGAKVQLLSARDRRLEVERDVMLAKNRERELLRELASLEAEKSAFAKGWRQNQMEELLAITRERNTLREELQKANKRYQLDTLLAPADGVVLEVTRLSRGSVIKEAEPMFTIVPIDAQLEAEVQIDSIDVGYIKPGDVAHIKFDAFPFQRHGSVESRVRTLSEDAFRRETNSAPGMEAYYLSRISLGPTPLKNMAEHTRLLPGMTLSAEVVVGTRSVMSYLIWPLTKGLDESIREP